MSEQFMNINRELNRIAIEYHLPDFSDLNEQRYPWTVPLLNKPAIYGSRLWEYPFALLSANLKKGMMCADIGCGMTAFTIYLQEMAKCQVIGIDSDVFYGDSVHKGFGISVKFTRKTGIKIIQSNMDRIPIKSNTFDSVFCLSVIEHVDRATARRSMQEMARILKADGKLIITVDVNMFSEISRPLDAIWDSGLQPLSEVNLKWPRRRLGIFCNGQEPADVFGMILVKKDYEVETKYPCIGEVANVIPASLIPTLVKQKCSVKPRSFFGRLHTVVQRIASGIIRRILP